MTTNAERYNGLDLARAILMLLGVVFHSALIFKLEGDWRVSSGHGSFIFNEVTKYIHYFRMEAFYIIAGFFFVLVFEKHGLKNTLKDRLIKLGVPMIIVGFTFNSLMNLLSENRSYSIGVNYILDGQWLGHLWFIGNLILYYILLSPLLLIWSSSKKAVFSKRFVLFITFILTPILVALLSRLGSKLFTGNILFISFGKLYHYLPFFILGMYYWKVRSVVIPLLTMKTSIFLLLVFTFLRLIDQYLFIAEISWTLSLAFNSLVSLCLGISVIAFFNSLGQNKSQTVDKLVNSSYSIYLFHQPLIIVIFVFLLADLNINLYLSFFTLCTIVYLLSYILHTKVIENSPLLLFCFNGKK